jgi:predicted sulfurtransferase
MIDDAENKDLLCRSMLMRKFRPNFETIYSAWDPLVVLGRIYVAKEGINAQLSLPADNFYAFKDTIEAYDFMQGMR